VKLIIFILAIFITGCDIWMSGEEINTLQQFCEPHGGLVKINTDFGYGNCGNGIRIYLTDYEREFASHPQEGDL